MKVAVLHDYLNQFGGAERVLKVILELFPDADLYTLLYDEQKTFGLFKKNIKGTSFLDHEWVRRHHRMFIPFMPFASRMLKGNERYDLVISSTAGYAKGFAIDAPYHVSYCHSPLRYAWEIDYLKNLPFSPHAMSKEVLRPIAEWLKRWDKRAADRVNLFIANSNFIREKIRAYYGRDAEVVYPPVSMNTFYHEPETPEGDYYLMVGRMLYYKGFDLGIKAFNRMRRPLVVIGRGPEERKLRSLADPRYVTFVQSVSDERLRRYYNGARGLIFPQIEDFGLVAAEAQACGTPVLAFAKGGGSEIVEDGTTGLLFTEQTPDAIQQAVRRGEQHRFNRKHIARRAERFSEESFKKEFLESIRRSGFSLS